MKKWMALLMASVVAFGLLTACSSSLGQTPVGPPPQQEEVDLTVPELEEAPVMEEVILPEPVGSVDTVILRKYDDEMLNTYAVLAVNPEAPFVDADGNAVADVAVNTAGADALIRWLLSQEALHLIGSYGKEEVGDRLFYINSDTVMYAGEIAPAAEATRVIRLSTTTSVNDSGLLAALLPVFEENYGYTVEVHAVDTGRAIAAAKNGNADLILVHSKEQEDAFVKEGFARVVEGMEAERVPFIYNYFVLCGPSTDPAGVAGLASITDAFAAIAEAKFPFVSRGDGSDTHTKELSLWPQTLGITAESRSFAEYTDWYNSVNAGMGACLVMAEEMGAYILTDESTFLTFQMNDGVME